MKGISILKTGVLALCLMALLFLAGCPWYDDDDRHHGRRNHYEDHDDRDDDHDRHERRERHDRW